jgi:3-oxoacyl-[acyl-carrier-protein] synthase-3
VDHLVLHQANAQMIRHLAQKLGATPEQAVVALAGFGNTSSASIPLALTEALGQRLCAGPARLLLSGFGVGWSWGSAAVAMGPLGVCETLLLRADGSPLYGRSASSSPAKAAGAAKDAGEPAKAAEG